MNTFRDRDGSPAYLRPGVGDHAAALALSNGILAALRVRDRAGEGQEVSVNLMHIGFYVQGNDASMALTTGIDTPRHDRNRPRNPLWNHYRTKDERWVFLVMINSDLYWPALCRAIERPELADDARFSNAVERYRQSAELTPLLAEIFAARDLADWEKQLAPHSLIWSPVRSLSEAMADPQAAEMEMFASVDHPEVDGLRTVAPPLQLSLHPMRGERPAPALGADGAAILREAGCSEPEIAAALGPANSTGSTGSTGSTNSTRQTRATRVPATDGSRRRRCATSRSAPRTCTTVASRLCVMSSRTTTPRSSPTHSST
jgi:formyl-CoA transferase